MTVGRVVPSTGIFERIRLIIGTIPACLVLLTALPPGAAAQGTLSVTRVSTNVNGGQFRVDGKQYGGPASFVWPTGSKHELTVVSVQISSVPATRYTLLGWFAGDVQIMPMSNTAIVTADPALPNFQAKFSVEYSLTLNFFNCPSPPCQAPGTVYVNGDSYTQSTELWLPAGAAVKLQAIPNTGFVFLGWFSAMGNVFQGFLNTVTMSGPTAAYPRFSVARRIHLATSPPGLNLFADRTTVPTPAVLDWGLDTIHTLAPVSPQDDPASRLWVFQSWSDGGPATHAYQVTHGSDEPVITANYVPGVRVTFLTSPGALALSVDGRSNWMAYNFAWGVGETHRVSASAQQTDAKGRIYNFRQWSNGGAAGQEFVLDASQAATGIRLTAFYDPLVRLQIQTSTPGIPIQVDGNDCPAPCQVDRQPGAQVRIHVPDSVPVGDESRLDFLGWSDGSAGDKVLTVAADASLTASYRQMNRLAVSADPPEGVRWRLQPAAADGYYDIRQQVMVAVETQPGYRFLHWEGDLSGSFASGMLSMAIPRSVLARLEPVPFVPPAGVRNAAGDNGDPSVAPGSVIAVLGVNLAPATENGPDSPLAQTLAGVTVRLGERLLPLFSVSPGQVNALLPSDVEAGTQTLILKWEGKPETRVDFPVVRNAPGLFCQTVDEQAFVVALHEDGSAVSVSAPARPGELITFYGTGFGPYQPAPPDGFAVPDTLAYPLADPVEIVLGEAVATPDSSVAAPGRVGVIAVRVRLDPNLPAGNVQLKARVNGQESNTGLLPVGGQ